MILKENKRYCYISFTIYSTFKFLRLSSQWQILYLCNNILKVKKQHYLRRYYRYIIKTIIKLQHDRVLFHMELGRYYFPSNALCSYFVILLLYSIFKIFTYILHDKNVNRITICDFVLTAMILNNTST